MTSTAVVKVEVKGWTARLTNPVSQFAPQSKVGCVSLYHIKFSIHPITLSVFRSSHVTHHWQPLLDIIKTKHHIRQYHFKLIIFVSKLSLDITVAFNKYSCACTNTSRKVSLVCFIIIVRTSTVILLITRNVDISHYIK